jgi:hypothetical protein
MTEVKSGVKTPSVFNQEWNNGQYQAMCQFNETPSSETPKQSLKFIIVTKFEFYLLWYNSTKHPGGEKKSTDVSEKHIATIFMF